MPKEITWADAEELGIQLEEKHPELDPLKVRFTELHKLVMALDSFVDDPINSSESKLEAIQMAWYEEWQEAHK